MSRFKTEDALVLRTRACGESNREAFFLTGGQGIIRAIVYGGPKSKLRAMVSPFHSGVVYLYHDPVRDSYKVSDFDVRFWHPGIRENYERTMAAGALCETILAGHGGGFWREALDLACAVFAALEDAGTELCSSIVVYFLWKWAELLGVRPEFPRNAALSYSSAIRWLYTLEPLELSALNNHIPDGGTLCTAKNLCMDILAAAFGRRLPSWNW
ncbi:MAG: recombination protein O N-terminal domain-containing protein [Spirochaetaceae bacterium]|jgi:DNA repair protein RecO (recombination protein O)|nr:recombination protein O N-terminal domain-containing protein [Spirochaetaceae bacterium]